jgi:phage shock protein A
MEEMKCKGITPEMLEAMAIAMTTRDSVKTQQQLAKSLDAQSESIYASAKSAAIEAGDEVLARKLLKEQQCVKRELVQVLKTLVEDRKRLEMMESYVYTSKS